MGAAGSKSGGRGLPRSRDRPTNLRLLAAASLSLCCGACAAKQTNASSSIVAFAPSISLGRPCLLKSRARKLGIASSSSSISQRRSRSLLLSASSTENVPAPAVDADLRGNTAVALWTVICVEGRVACAQDQDISAMLHSNVLSHDRLADAVTVLLANKLATPFIGAMEVGTIMTEMFEADPEVEEIMAADILAHALRDSDDGTDLLSVLLFHKGFHALATYRLAHWLWQQGRRQLARFFQSVNSEVCAADIHPASRIGRGIFLASGCDVVIGETAVVGNNVIIHSGVTLGGTGKERGDRHPKVADGVQIGVSASVLGNIKVGEGAHVGSCSVVVKEILPYTANKGVPSKLAGWLVCDVEAGGNLVAGQHPMMVVEATKK